MLTYQMVYLLWVKLEVEETKTTRNGSCDPSTTPTQRGRES